MPDDPATNGVDGSTEAVNSASHTQSSWSDGSARSG
jgi:hypothetical protein